jgi:hypothetical protein
LGRPYATVTLRTRRAVVPPSDSDAGEAGAGSATTATAAAPGALDAFSVAGSDVLWFAACNESKPAMSPSDGGGEGASGAGKGEEHFHTQCWTLVSTAAFAVRELGLTAMQDPGSDGAGAFRPQDNTYLNGAGGPAEALLQEFRRVAPGGAAVTAGEVVYLQGQRWGSALPQPVVRPCKFNPDVQRFVFSA